MEQFITEAEKEFKTFMLDEYGKWKIGRAEAQAFLTSKLTQAYQLGKEEGKRESLDKYIGDILKALKGQKIDTSAVPFFAYCKKHKDVHSSLQMEGGCFEDILTTPKTGE